MSPFEWNLIERVTVAGPDGNGRRRHRAFPSAAHLRNGTLMVAYRVGSDHHISPDGEIWLCRSTDAGHTWSSPQRIVAEPGRDFGSHLGLRELGDGTLILPLGESHRFTGRPPYFGYYERLQISAHWARSTDGGLSWQLSDSLDLGSHVVWTGNYGDILYGAEGEIWSSVAWQQEGEAHYRTGLLRSRDGGLRWDRLVQVAGGVDDEKSVCILPSGRWIAVMRDWDRPSKCCFTEDGGENWTPAAALPFHGQSPSLLQTQSGVLLCAYRQRGPGRPQGVGLAYSFDGGKTWAETDPLYISPVRDCAYPVLLETSPGEYIAVYYTAAVGAKYLTSQDYGADPHSLSPELIKYADADNAIELVRFRQR